jgi:hypothetical protein
VAGGTLPGGSTQQWRCAIVVVPIRFAKSMMTRNSFASVSSVTRANPMPGEAFGGFSFGPVSVVTNAIGVACANAVSSEAATSRTSRRASDIACSFGCSGHLLEPASVRAPGLRKSKGRART